MRVLYASDIHGSETCFRKFINAVEFYGLDVLILGGDLSGKAVLPIIAEAGGYHRAQFMGTNHTVSSGRELEELERSARAAGMYPLRTTADKARKLTQDPLALNEVFTTAVLDSVTSWMRLAEERLPPRVECYVMPGNDDIGAVEAAIKTSTRVINPETKRVMVGGTYEMVSIGLSNRTPFDSPREADEHGIARILSGLLETVERMDLCILNSHCPPHGTSLDLAPELDKDLGVITTMGRPHMIPVGSTAVRDAIARSQPLVGLHGHCHESRGMARIGRTICLNPGSEYATGILRGVVVTLSERKKTVGYQFVAA